MSFSDSSSDKFKDLVHQLIAATREAVFLIHQQKEMSETHLSDLQQQRDRDRIDKLKARTAKLRSDLRKSKDSEKRRQELQKERLRFRKRQGI